MGADFSKVRSNALVDYAGVELKQGAVLLDADANELNAILDRRLRALAGDVLGRATVGANTPDAFRVAPGTTSSGAATLLIGPGRLYVDGLLAENHGKADPAQRVFDALMAEPAFSQPIPYDAQPYLPDPPPLPRAGRHLVYLDVWNREVTHLEQPDLVEAAVGVETSSRLQTVWQVRVLGKDAGTDITCATPDADLPGWSGLIAPSTGVLSTGTFEVAAVDDPCELPPTGGFRGLENQLYRVEIHDPGQPGGAATFKWSRENASVGSRIVSMISSSELELETLGRDEVLRFNTGDWVEITDDLREFTQLPGEMARIIAVEEATRQITLETELTGTTPGAPNLRVRRWDQKAKIFRTGSGGTAVEFQDLDTDQTGVIRVPPETTTLLLENGVTVSFASIGGLGSTGFRAGDYWVFAARTADASVELLKRAPPRGIHHHYARLAIWDVSADTMTDCRNPWPPLADGHDCSCTACVTVEDHNSGRFTIQTAIDQAKTTGGRICLGPGLFQIKAPIRIVGALALELVGNRQTLLVAPPGNQNGPVPAILVDNSFSVTLTEFDLVMSPGAQFDQGPGSIVISTPGIMIQNSASVTVERCQFYSFGNLLPQNAAIALGGFVGQTSVRQNSFHFLMPEAENKFVIGFGTGVGHLPTIADKPNPLLLTFDLYVEDNFMHCGSSGVSLDTQSYHALQVGISRNVIGPAAVTGIAVAGIGVPASFSRIEVTGNEIVVTRGVTGIGGGATATFGTGIACGVSAARISDNDVVPLGPESGGGILLSAPQLPMVLDGCQILGNRVGGVGGIGIEIRPALGTAMIKQNTIQNAAGGGIIMTASARAQHLSIANNQILGVAPSPANTTVGQLQFAFGMRLNFVAAAEIQDNIIRELGMNFPGNGSPVGIVGVTLIACSSASIAGNQITNIGPLSVPTGPSAGVVMTAPFDRADVSNNVIRRSDPLAPGIGDWRALFLGPLANFASGLKFNVVQTAPSQLILVGDLVLVAMAEGMQLAAVRGNVLAGASANVFGPPIPPSFVGLTVTGSCIFTDNQAVLAASGRALASLGAPVVAAANNILNGGTPPLQIGAPENKFTVLGNITSTTIMVNGQPLAGVWAPLNVHG